MPAGEHDNADRVKEDGMEERLASGLSEGENRPLRIVRFLSTDPSV